MKNEMKKKICALALVFVLSCGFSANVLAAEFAVSPETTEQADTGVTPYADPVVTGSIKPLNTAHFIVHLSPYIGFSKTFRVTTQSSGTTGGVDIIVKYDDKYISDGQWWMGINNVKDWALTLPSSGDYSVSVVNQSDSVVYVTMQWV